jgi:hypothetical protein
VEEKNGNGKSSVNMTEYMQNPKGFAIRKWLADLLKNDYDAHDQVVERISASLVTQKDLEEFGKLIGCVYSAGFMKAFTDYKSQLEKLGLNINLTVEDPNLP